MHRIVVERQLYSISQFPNLTYWAMTTWLTYSHNHRLCDRQQLPGLV